MLDFRLLKLVIEQRKLSDLKAKGITEKFFDGKGLSAFRWLTSFVEKSGEYPDFHSFRLTFAIDSEVFDDDDSYDFLIEKIHERRTAWGIRKSLSTALDNLEKRNVAEALEVLNKCVSDSELLRTDATLVDYDERRVARFEEYVERRESGIPEGLDTQWPTINSQCQGLVPGNLHVIAASTATGKTWILAALGDFLARKEKILFVTLEMSEKRIERRLDAIRYKLPFLKLRDASLGDEELDEWKDKVFEPESMDGRIVIAGKKLVQSVPDIQFLLNDHDFSVVLVDGGYRLVGRGKSSWEKQVSVVEELQIAAEMSGIPWVVTTQTNQFTDTKRRSEKGTGERIRYAKEWLINPDVVLELRRTVDADEFKRLNMSISKIRDGDGSPKEFQIHFDLTRMVFEEIPIDIDEEAEAVVEF
jgi:hypothetical protein